VLGQAFLPHVRRQQQDWKVLTEASLLDLPAEHEPRLVRQLGAQHHQVRPA
jgi:hypothetical protein